MRNSIALFAAAAAPLVTATLETATNGGALIVNYCNYDIPLKNIAAQGTGVENGQEVDKTLAASNAGEDSQYFTNWIKLNVEGGWSMKLNTLGNWNNIMQYEYTWTGDNQVWYDMSFVNGVESDHPKWEFLTGDSGPLVNAYTFATDDAQGMQEPVATSATVTLVLCPESTGATGVSIATSTSAAAVTTAAPVTTTTTTSVAPAYTPPSSSSTTLATSYSAGAGGKNVELSSSPVVVSTPVATTSEGDYDIVTEYATQIVTVVATETAHAKAKRHEHRHPHGHQF